MMILSAVLSTLDSFWIQSTGLKSNLWYHTFNGGCSPPLVLEREKGGHLPVEGDQMEKVSAIHICIALELNSTGEKWIVSHSPLSTCGQ